MTKKEYQKMMEETLAEIQQILHAKNHDYTAGSPDPFANFRLAELEGVDPVKGVMVRVSDKMQRLRAFIRSGKLLVKGESFEDAIHDIIGYMILIKGMLIQKSNDEDRDSSTSLG